MTTKEKIKEDLDDLPNELLKQVYQFIKSDKRKNLILSKTDCEQCTTSKNFAEFLAVTVRGQNSPLSMDIDEMNFNFSHYERRNILREGILADLFGSRH